MDWFRIETAPQDGRPVWVKQDASTDPNASNAVCGWAYWQPDAPGGYWVWAGRKGRPAYPSMWAEFEPARRF